jgi:hypothetical protein
MKLSPKLSLSPKLFHSAKNPVVASIRKNTIACKEDKYEETIRFLQRNYEAHILSCSKIYQRMKEHQHTNIYPALVRYAKALTTYRIFDVYSRIEKAIGNISFLHDVRFSFLYLFIGNSPIIENKTSYFSFFLNHENEDMSKIYIHCKLMRGSTIKKYYYFYTFEELKNFISNFILVQSPTFTIKNKNI